MKPSSIDFNKFGHEIKKKNYLDLEKNQEYSEIKKYVLSKNFI